MQQLCPCRHRRRLAGAYGNLASATADENLASATADENVASATADENVASAAEWYDTPNPRFVDSAEQLEPPRRQRPLPPPPTPPHAGRWRRLVTVSRHHQRLRRLWGVIGNFLHGYPQELRDQLREVYPQELRDPRRHGVVFFCQSGSHRSVVDWNVLARPLVERLVLASATADENVASALRRWRRLVLATRRLRRLQRLWGVIGNFLQGSGGRSRPRVGHG